MPKPPGLTQVVAATMVAAALAGSGFVVYESAGGTPRSAAGDVSHARVVDTAADGGEAAAPAAAAEGTLATQETGAEQLLESRVEKRAKLLARLVERQVQLPVSFDLATFNLLGAMHTTPGSDASQFANWRIRAEWTAQYIQSKSLDIVGLQEVEPHQYDALMAATGGAFDGWPAKYMRGVHNRAIMTTLIWRTSEWSAVERSYLTIPFMSWKQEIPVVKLRSKSTGREIWVINAHNAPRSLQGQRDQATTLEIAKINELAASGLPIFFIGDMNEQDKIFNRVTTETALTTPTGRKSGRIDQIFGPAGVKYSGFAVDRPALVAQITDHNVVKVAVSLPAS